jgi:uncharacterized membrane protein YsdA (DUF1294 family)
MAKHHKSATRTYALSLLPGLGIPAAFTAMYSTTLNFAPLWVWLVTINLTIIGLMGKDKLAATKKWPRTPEFTLLFLGFLGGAPGLIASRYIFNHKTSKQSFQYMLFGVLALQLVAILYFWPTLKAYL